MQLNGAHILITGGSKGIGAAAARALRAEGARLTLIARDSAELHATADAVQGHAIACDLTDPAQFGDLIARAEAEQGPLGVLINNAALGATRHFATLSAEDVRRTLTTNLLAPMELARQAVRSMIPRGKGAVLNVSSVAGELAVPHLATYGPSKAGLSMFSLDLQRDLRGSGIDVSFYVLGAVPDTGIYDEGTSNNAVIKKLADQLGRFATLTPEQIARRMVKTLRADHQGAVAMPFSSAPAVQMRLLPCRLGDLVFSRGEPPVVDLGLEPTPAPTPAPVPARNGAPA